MLVRFFPHQVAEHWESILKEAIRAGLPPIAGESDEKMNNVLKNILIGNLQCWVSYLPESNIPNGVVCTKIAVDDISETRSLLIYCLSSFDKTMQETWESGIETLCKFGAGNGCEMGYAYSNVPGILNIARRLGAETEYTYISFPLS